MTAGKRFRYPGEGYRTLLTGLPGAILPAWFGSRKRPRDVRSKKLYQTRGETALEPMLFG